MLLSLAQNQAQLPFVLVLQRFAGKRANCGQIGGQGGLFAHPKLSSTPLAVQPLGFQALDRVHHIAVDDFCAHDPVQDEGTVVKSARNPAKLSIEEFHERDHNLHSIAGHLDARIVGDGDMVQVTQVRQRAQLIQIGQVVPLQVQHLQRGRQVLVTLTQMTDSVTV
jgi:hypothetical protein